MAVKRTVDEWITVARVSRGSAHIFFEGPTDARVMAHAAGYPESIDFRSADEIEQDPTGASSLWGGKKMILMILSSRASAVPITNICCLIDSDFDFLISNIGRNANLIRTEFANLPVCSFTFEWLKAFLIKAYGEVLDDHMWKFICSTLKFAFVSRYIMACREHPNPAPAISDFVAFKGGIPSFSNEAYLSRYFGNIRDRGSVTEDVHSLYDWLDCDVRYVANSNDVFDIIYVLLRKRGRISGSMPRDAIRHAYLAALDDNIINEDGLTSIREWISSFRDVK